MFAYIKGRLDSKKTDSVTVEAGGVGYRVFTSLSTLSRLPAIDSEVKLYTYFIVREDAHTLYGFCSREELGMFETLLSVSGVGPKASLALLSAVSPSQFGLAVLNEDYRLLTRAQGVGAKLAQKIIFELRDKMKKELAGSAEAGGILGGAGGIAGAGPVDHGKYGEAVEAMIVLGCSAVEANGIISNVYNEESTLEEIIRKALALLGR